MRLLMMVLRATPLLESMIAWADTGVAIERYFFYEVNSWAKNS